MASVTPRYGSFTVRTECTHCGQPLPVNGPVQRVHCGSCQNDVALADGIWSTVLGDFDDACDSLAEGAGVANKQEVAGFTVHYEYSRAVPRCEKCGAPFPADRLEPGAARDFFCVACGDPASAYPAPQWLRNVVPNAREIYSTEPGAGPAAAHGAVVEPPQDAAKPVVMACPQCGASLRLTSQSERTTGCQFCKTDVYLPDDLWRRLHPVKVVRPWYVRFEGETQRQREAERRAQERRREAERQAARDDSLRAEASRLARLAGENQRAKDAEVARLKRRAYAWLGAVVALMALTLGCIQLCLSTDLLGVAEVPACAALGGIAIVVFLVTVFMASRPVKLRTGYDGNMMMFVAWFFLIFGFVMPVVGQVMVLVVGLWRFTGKLGGATITVNGSSTSYPSIRLTRGETFPLGFAYVAFALWWPAAVVGFSQVAT
jgi:hypothetical protein